MTINLPRFNETPSPTTHRLVPLDFLQQMHRRLDDMQHLLWAQLIGMLVVAFLVGLR
jgi:hypothetical protein